MLHELDKNTIVTCLTYLDSVPYTMTVTQYVLFSLNA